MNTLEAKVKLVEELNTGEHGFLKYDGKLKCAVLNRRKFKNKEALKWAFSFGWLAHEPNGKSYTCFSGEVIYTGVSQPDIFWLDHEVLWEILKDACHKHSGGSITKNPVWEKLGLFEVGHGCYKEYLHFPRMVEALNKLARFGYIYFLSAGDIWNIEVIER